ncbi:cytochrome c biogenesis protein CcsA [Klebsiella pneumoniae subsp. pneumoniae]|nr:cytochrome c biogenesis protein CcsA [Klebsiella pneumoniae subsp. pneumoniae]
MGYVGFSVAFAFAIASLLAGRLDTAWARWSRPRTQAAWMFLTLGIVLGSAWAYYELGWGGWWFWDPVENASFMPWLVGTALLHSPGGDRKAGQLPRLDGAAGHRRLLPVPAGHLPGALRGAGFGACLRLGSVARAVYSGTADCRHRRIAAAVRPEGRPGARARVESYAVVARVVPALGNNILLMAAMLVVLLGTLLPLVHKSWASAASPIGEPFFNTMFTALMAPFALLLGLGPLDPLAAR